MSTMKFQKSSLSKKLGGIHEFDRSSGHEEVVKLNTKITRTQPIPEDES